MTLVILSIAPFDYTADLLDYTHLEHKHARSEDPGQPVDQSPHGPARQREALDAEPVVRQRVSQTLVVDPFACFIRS